MVYGKMVMENDISKKHILAVIGILCITCVLSSAVAKTVIGKKVFIFETNATSTLGNKYKPLYAFDGELDTCWAEGTDGHGIGEILVINSGPHDEFDVKNIRIFSGYGKSAELFYKNSRIEKMEIVVFTYTSSVGSKKVRKLVTFNDKPEFKTIPINKKNVYKINFKILEVYEGSKWDDTCISDIEIVSDQIQLVNKQWNETDIVGKETYTRTHNMHFKDANMLTGGITKFDMREQPRIEGTWEMENNRLFVKYVEDYFSKKRGPYKKELIFKGYIQKGDKKRLLLYGDEFVDYIAKGGL